MQIIVPKRWASFSRSLPLFFLAGPIIGGGDWQARFCPILQKAHPDCLIACPCHWKMDHPLASFFIGTDNGLFHRALDWEHHFLEVAGAREDRPGCAVFWLGLEDSQNPRQGTKPYAMNSRREAGKWGYRLAAEGARVVFGAEPGFPGLGELQHDISLDLGYELPVYYTMEETAKAAITMAFKSQSANDS